MEITEPFPDLASAGRAIAPLLETYRGREDTIVLALVRGGVPLGAEVAKHLGLPFDFIILKRLMPSGDARVVKVAFSVAGTRVYDDGVSLDPEPPLDVYMREALAVLDARERACRGDRPPLSIEGKTVLIVDNGIRTGNTMWAGIRAVRKCGAARVVAAVPVGNTPTRALIESVADETVALMWTEQFINAGRWYRKLSPPMDEETRGYLEVSSAVSS